MGKGSTFTLYFPARLEADAPQAASDLHQPPATMTKARSDTILVVDDEDAVRAVTGALLRRQGYEVLEAATPGAAIELFERHAGAIDLLVTDVVMPDLNGPALAQRLVGDWPKLRVLFMSGLPITHWPKRPSTPRGDLLENPTSHRRSWQPCTRC
jgi:DNA-binding NtrC family response regulator